MRILLVLFTLLSCCNIQAQYEIYINEVMAEPLIDTLDKCQQSMINEEFPECGREWLELFNKSACDTIDISCWLIGYRGNESDNYGSFCFPDGTLLYPQQFITIGGAEAANNNGLTFNLNDYIGSDQLCYSGVTKRWFMSKSQGNLSLYDDGGVFVDAVYWTWQNYAPEVINDNGYTCFTTSICKPDAYCYSSYLPSCSEIVDIEYAGIMPNIGPSIKRSPDGSDNWVYEALTESPGNCNAECLPEAFFDIVVSTENSSCDDDDGSASVSITGGTGNVQVVWSYGSSNENSIANLSAGEYWVEVTNGNDCILTEYFEIQPLQIENINLEDIYLCIGEGIPLVDVNGYEGTVYWYVSEISPYAEYIGNTFVLPINGSQPGTHTFWVEHRLQGCISDRLPFQVIISPFPDEPEVYDISICNDGSLPTIQFDASGEIHWFANSVFQTPIHIGTTFPLTWDMLSPGDNHFFVENWDNDCPSDRVSFNVYVSDTPLPPIIDPLEVCEGDPLPIIEILSNTQIHWFSSMTSTSEIEVGDSYNPNISSASAGQSPYTYYVESHIGDCISERVPVQIIVVNPPASPESIDITICSGEQIPVLNAEGNGVTWYAANQTDVIGQGQTYNANTLANSDSSPYIYYYSVTNNACESPLGTYTIIVQPVPQQPIIENITLCEGETFIPNFGVTLNQNEELYWYDSANSNSAIGSGVNFSDFQIPESGSVTFYFHIENSTCSSLVGTFSIEILPAPIVPNVPNIIMCEDEALEPFIIQLNSGETIEWFSDSEGNLLIGSNASYLPNVPSSLNENFSQTIYYQLSIGTCVSEIESTQITVQILPQITEYNIQNASCGTSDGSIEFITVESNSETQLQLYDAQGNFIIFFGDTADGLSSGSYTVQISEVYGCDNEFTFSIGDAEGPQIDTATIVDATCGQENGTIENVIYNVGSVPIEEIVWSNAQGQEVGNTNDLTDVSAGTYTVTMIDESGCEAVASFTIESGLAPEIIGGVANEPTCGETNGFIDQIIINSETDYTLEWIDESGAVFNTSSLDIDGLSQGQFTIRITDSNDCSDEKTFDIGSSATIEIEGGTITDASCGQSNGSIENISITTEEDYDITWNDLSGNETVPNQLEIAALPAGNYELTVTTISGCTDVAPFEISNESGPEITDGNPINADCGSENGSVISISINSSVPIAYYSWTDNANNEVGTAETLQDVGSGLYHLTIEDENGCTNAMDFTISENDGPEIGTAQENNASCGANDGSIINVTVSNIGNNASFTWTNDVNETIGEEQNLMNIPAGTYQLTVEDNGCSAVEAFSISSNEGPEITGGFVNGTTCGGSDGSITGISVNNVTGYDISWTNENGEEINSSSLLLQDLSAGSYALTVSSNDCEAIENYVVEGGEGPQLSGGQVSNVTCDSSGSITDIEITGGSGTLTILWTLNGTTLSNDEIVLTNASVGNYIVTVIDENACEDELPFVVIATEGPEILDVEVNHATCGIADGSIVNIDIQNNATIESIVWTNDLDEVVQEDSMDLLDVGTGNYTLSITDSNGCEATITEFVNTVPGPELGNGVIDNSNCGQADGSITNVSLTGGFAPFTYKWFDSSNTEIATTPDLVNVIAGVYLLQVRDVYTCLAEKSYEIEDDEGPEIGEGLIEGTHCGQDDGSILNVITTGGIAPYIYEWQNNNAEFITNENDLTQVAAGIYTLVVIDSVGCSANRAFEILDESGPTILDATIDPVICGNNIGAIYDLQIESVYDIASYEWVLDNNIISSEQNISEQGVGIYQLTVQDQNGCSVSQIFEIIEVPGPQIEEAMVNNATCDVANGSINSLIVSGGIGTLSYTWTDAENNVIGMDDFVADLNEGSYSIMVQDENLCSSLMSFDVVQEFSPEIINYEVLAAHCAQFDGSIFNIEIESYWDDMNYELISSDNDVVSAGEWNNLLTEGAIFSIENLYAGNYELQITDENLCSSSVDIFIDELPGPTAIIALPNELTCSVNQVILDGIESTEGVLYEWTTEHGQIVSSSTDSSNIIVSQPGYYWLNVTDPLTGCMHETEVFVIENETFPYADAGEDMMFFNEVNMELLDGTGSNSFGNSTILWTTEDGEIAEDEDSFEPVINNGGTYTINITDDETGCSSWDDVFIEIVEIHKGLVVLPNAFSPNDDNVNDIFRIIGEWVDFSDMQIFDRWGNKLFQIENAFDGWNGTFGSQQCELGVYTYVVSVTFQDGSTFQYQGNVTLIR